MKSTGTNVRHPAEERLPELQICHTFFAEKFAQPKTMHFLRGISPKWVPLNRGHDELPTQTNNALF